MDDDRYVKPIDPEVARWADGLTPNQREAFEERAGIKTALAGYSRETAELLAMQEISAWIAEKQNTGDGEGHRE